MKFSGNKTKMLYYLSFIILFSSVAITMASYFWVKDEKLKSTLKLSGSILLILGTIFVFKAGRKYTEHECKHYENCFNPKLDKVIYYISFVVLFSFVAITIASDFFIKDTQLQKLLTILCPVILFISAFFIARIDYKYSEYQCNHCGSYFKPTFSEYFWGVKLWKSGQTKYLVCSKCGKKGWCKRKFKF